MYIHMYVYSFVIWTYEIQLEAASKSDKEVIESFLTKTTKTYLLNIPWYIKNKFL